MRRLLAVFIAALFPFLLQAQGDWRFSRFSDESGLTAGGLSAVEQDTAGYVWVGGQSGLYRYDGYEFKAYYQRIGDSCSLTDNHILELKSDGDGRLWATGMANGVSRYLPASDNFRQYTSTLSGDPLDAFSYTMLDRNGQLIIARGHGGTTAVYDPEEDAFRTIEPPGSAPENRKDWIPLVLSEAGQLFFMVESNTNRPNRLFCHDFELDSTWRVGFSFKWINHAIEYPAGTFWFGTWGGGIIRYNLGRDEVRRFLAEPDAQQTVGPNVIKKLRLNADGEVLAATNGGLMHFRTQDEFDFYSTNPDDPTSLGSINIDDILVDREGGIWLPGSGGLSYHHSHHNKFKWFPEGSEGGLSGGGIDYIEEDRQGKIWLMKPEGIDRLDPLSGEVLRLQHDPDDPYSIGAGRPAWFGQDADGNIWANIYGSGNNKVDSKTGRQIAKGVALGRRGFTRMYADPKGRTWVSGFFGVYEMVRNHDSLALWWDEPLIANWDGREMIMDRQGKLWVGSWNQGLLILNPETREWDRIFPNVSGDTTANRIEHAVQVIIDDRGTIWTVGNGMLASINTETLESTCYTEIGDVPLHLVFDLAAHEDDIWLSTPKGLIRWTPELDQVVRFDKMNGLPSSDYGPLLLSKSGHLFAAGVGGLLRFHPDSIDLVAQSTGITFNSVLKKDEEGNEVGVLQDDEVQISYRDDYLEFRFSAMTYAPTGGLTYEYRIDGKSGEWNSLGEQRQLTLLDPSPGSFDLLVRARGRDGGQVGETGRLSIHVSPPWWQTDWAWFSYGLLILMATWAYTQFRTRALRMRQVKLERTVHERTAQIREQKREIEIEKDRSEELLLNILPYEVAEELKANGKAEARDFEKVSILFTDFEGFTKMASQLEARELVEEIDKCFKEFDAIVTTYGLEKIKTIGDAYMAAGGLPDPDKGSPDDVVRAALEMQEFLMARYQRRSSKGQSAFRMRVGVHSGPVVAGVVGVKKFQYDIWGDTVNIASRMESNGETDLVNVSESTYMLIRTNPEFKFRPRGALEVKGKGAMEMYFVESNLVRKRMPDQA